jgi:hypothetical protein
MSKIFWKSGTSGNWSDASNWIGGVAPVSTSDVVINNDVMNNVTSYANAPVSVASLTIDAGTGGYYISAYFNNLTVAGALSLTGSNAGGGHADLYNSGSLSAQTITGSGAQLYLGQCVVTAQSITGATLGLSLGGGSITAQTIDVDAIGTAVSETITGDVTADTIGPNGEGTTILLNGTLKGHASSSVPGQAYAYITNGATLEITGAAAAHALLYDIGVGFNPTLATTLKLDSPALFIGSVGMTDIKDRVDLAGVAPGSLSFSPTSVTSDQPGLHVSGTDSAGKAIAFDLYERSATTAAAFSAIVTSDGQNGSLISLAPGKVVSVAANTTVVAQTGTTYLGAGHDIFSVTPITIADMIDGGGNSLLFVTQPGAATMGGNITGITTVGLLGGISGGIGHHFTANGTTGLTIFGSTGQDVITAGDASQTVFLYGLGAVVQASAANAGVTVHGVGATPRLEITGGGSATLNNADDCGLVVQLDAATTLTMNSTGFTTVIAQTAGSVITTHQAFQTLESVAGGDTFIDGGTGHDIFKGTQAGLNTDVIQNFQATDTIDIIDLAPSATVTYTQTNTTGGTLSYGSGSLTLTGQFVPGTLHLTADGQGGSLVQLTPVVSVAAGAAVLVLPNTAYVGAGGNTFFVTPTTIAQPIAAGGGGALTLLTGGTAVMGDNITGISTVHLGGGAVATNFTANATQNLLILGNQGADIITPGDASQIIYGFGTSTTVMATAATAGVRLNLVHGTGTLDISGGGIATLNDNDAVGTIVTLDQATVLNMGHGAFISAIAKSAGSTLVAQQAFQTLESTTGGCTLVGATARNTAADTFQGTGAGLDQDIIQAFGWNDVLHITDVLPAAITTQQTAPTTDTLSFGTHSLTLQLAYAGHVLHIAGDGGSGSLITYGL